VKGDTALYLHMLTPTEYSKATGIYLYSSYNDSRLSFSEVRERIVGAVGFDEFGFDMIEQAKEAIKMDMWIEKLHALMGKGSTRKQRSI
jgi:hypothetical protein